MEFHPDKYQLLRITNKQKIINDHYLIHGKRLKLVDNTKYLGSVPFIHFFLLQVPLVPPKNIFCQFLSSKSSTCSILRLPCFQRKAKVVLVVLVGYLYRLSQKCSQNSLATSATFFHSFR